ncbi:MAG: ubiquinol-cytochrome c reductase iron-sulfur subunit, partial [bacterium]
TVTMKGKNMVGLKVVQNIQRRTFLKILIGVLNGLATLALTIPGISYVLTPLFRKQEDDWIEIGRIQDFIGNAITKTVYRYISSAGYTREEKKAFAWISRREDGELIAFSPKCTHKGCNVAWIEGNGRFECPCHGGMYGTDGGVIAGPPPRPLDRHAVKVENGRIFIKRIAS